MSDTIPDILVSNTTYSDVNTLSGIAVGTALVISNKSTSPILLQIAASQPSASSNDGEILSISPNSTSVKIITVGENTVWAKSLRYTDAPLSVQDNT